MNLPKEYSEFEVLVNRQLENKLRNTFNQLKNDGCEFVLCLENFRDQTVHDLFKKIAYTEYGKNYILSFFSCFF